MRYRAQAARRYVRSASDAFPVGAFVDAGHGGIDGPQLSEIGLFLPRCTVFVIVVNGPIAQVVPIGVEVQSAELPVGHPLAFDEFVATLSQELPEFAQIDLAIHGSCNCIARAAIWVLRVWIPH
jgi:hypothetical protein